MSPAPFDLMGALHLNDLFSRGTIQKFDSGGCLTEAFCLTRPLGPCGTCDEDSFCALVARSCNACAVNACLPKLLDTDNVIENGNAGNAIDGGDSGGKSNIGPIIGGVIGGLAVLGIIAFLLYRRWSKKKERELAMEDEKDAQFGRLREARASTHTVASMASGFSNVIQIAYVPGVTSASQPTSPGLSIPTVPRIPEVYRDSTSSIPRYPQSPVDDQVFFLMPNRASTYTARTGDRSSVATTIYGNNAVVSPVPAEVVRGVKASVVQVNAKSAPNSGPTTPELESNEQIPSVVTQRPGLKVVQLPGRSPLSQPPASPAFSIGDTYTKRAEKLRTPRSRDHFEHSDSESDITDSEEYTHHSRSQAQSKAKDRKSRGSYLSTDFETDSPFSDTNSETVSIDDLPLPPNSGMPPVNISVSRLSAQPSPRLAGRNAGSKETLQSVHSYERRSPFDDSNAVERR